MSIKKAYSGCIEFLGHYDKSSEGNGPAWRGLMRETPSAAIAEMSAGPQPTPEPPDDDNGPGG